MVKLWNQTHSVMVYNCLYYLCCFLYFVGFTMHMFHMVFSACMHALYCVIANLYYTISMFIYTQQLTSVTISCQLLIARYVLTIFSLTLEMDNCPICSRSVLAHSKKVKCAVCYCYYHIKCISLNHEDQNYIEVNLFSWYCCNCLSKIFPFNHIEGDDIFISEINNMDIDTKIIESLSESLFNPLELNNDDIYSPLCDVDPDANYFNELNAHISQNCNYYYEHSFSTIIQTRFKNMIDLNVFSLCHINIRSMKANLTSFEICLQNLEFEFSVIGITETWLTDSNSDLYNINGFNFVETHRTGRSGGGVGIFLRNNILYQIRSDLTLNNEFIESIFIEIDKDLFNKNWNIIIGVIYRPPNTDLKLFSDDINELLDTLEREHKYCYLMGDYNINLLNYNKHAETTSFIDILYAHSFLSLINRPTRVAKESATLVDKYSLLMHCIKIKSRAKSLSNEQYVFVGGNISFLCVLSCISEEA